MGRAFTITEIPCQLELRNRASVIQKARRYLVPTTTSHGVKPSAPPANCRIEVETSGSAKDTGAPVIGGWNLLGKVLLEKCSEWRDVLLAWLLALLAILATIFIQIEVPADAPASGKLTHGQHIVPMAKSAPRDGSCSERDFIRERC
jgi:hypothetical protein